jgi:predicted small secreted protein
MRILFFALLCASVTGCNRFSDIGPDTGRAGVPQAQECPMYQDVIVDCCLKANYVQCQELLATPKRRLVEGCTVYHAVTDSCAEVKP